MAGSNFFNKHLKHEVSMHYENLLYDVREDGIGIVTFNRPKRANAMSQPMLKELENLCGRMEQDKSLKCIIVTGAGPAFSAGFDLKDQAEAMPQGVADWVPLLEADFKGIMSFWNLSKPSIAAVNGPALAGGFELMLGCDLAIASETAVFGEPELKFGAGIVAMLLPWFVGPKVAKEMIYMGEDTLSAARALELGLVNRVVPAAEVMPAAIEQARKLAQMDPMVLGRTKLALNRTYEIMGMQRALRAALDIDIMIEGEGSQLKRDFLQEVRREGLGKALAWREARYAARS
jgi:enoyl-CoA hydratase